MSLALALGWAATTCVIGLHLPQVWRTCVRGLTAGVPSARAWVAMAVSVVWLGYGLYGGGVVQVVLNGTTLVLNAALLVRLLPGRGLRPALGGALLVLLSVLAVVGLGEGSGLVAVGVLGAVAGTVVYLPQLLALRRALAVDGVSPVSLWLQGCSGSCWLGYGLLRHEAVVWSPNVFVLVTTAWSLAVLRRRTAVPGLGAPRVREAALLG
ncbi:MAG TPA: PQ-loop domain-containing transporter [Mycobacteriales bacterium]|nr:PQ-loop domain-containing transporter [Mycobacteriales bacterium]